MTADTWAGRCNGCGCEVARVGCQCPPSAPRVDVGALRADQRFWSKVAVAGADDCWLWQASTRSTGYGRYWTGERYESAHRYAYEAAIGTIPVGLVIDHLCRQRLCVNPDHLEPVTCRENVRRGAAAFVLNGGRCKNGHQMTPANTYQRPNGWTNCRACGRERTAKWKLRQSA